MLTYTAVDRVLLNHEWSALRPRGGHCAECGGAEPSHEPGCDIDEALAERGFSTQPDREAARERLRQASEPMLPPTPITSA
jgi:hypothetical protein